MRPVAPGCAKVPTKVPTVVGRCETIGRRAFLPPAYEGRTDHPIEEAANVLLEKNTITKIGHNTSKFGDLNQKKIGEFLGLMKFSKKGCKILKDEYFKLLNSHKGPFHEAVSFDYAYITDMAQELVDKGYPVLPIIVKGTWCEIDTLQDLKRAKKIFK